MACFDTIGTRNILREKRLANQAYVEVDQLHCGKAIRHNKFRSNHRLPDAEVVRVQENDKCSKAVREDTRKELY